MTDEPPPAGTIEAPSEDSAPPEWQSGHRYLALAGLAIGAALLLVFLGPVVDILMVGLLVSFLLYTPCRALARRTRLSFGASVAVVYLVLFLALGWLTWQGAQALASHMGGVADELNTAAEQLQAQADGPPSADSVAEALSQVGFPSLLAQLHDLLAKLGDGATLGLGTIVGLVALVFTGAFFSVFLQLSLGGASGRIRSVVPQPSHREVALLLVNLDGVWVGYVVSMAIYCTLLTLGSLVLFWILGVPFPIGLAVFNGVITLIPSVGGLMGTIVTTGICLAYGSTRLTDMPPGTFALLVGVLHCVLVQATYNFIALPVISRYVRLPVAAVLIFVLAALATGSPLLAFLIPPLLSTARLIGAYVLAKVQRREPFPGETVPEPVLPGFFSQMYFPVK